MNVLRLFLLSMLAITLAACDKDSSRRAPPPAIAATSIPQGMMGETYPTQTFTATGGQGVLAWSLNGGGLPTGLALSSTGELTGTPTDAGSFSFTVVVTDARGQTDSSSMTMEVIGADPVVSAFTIPETEVSLAIAPQTLSATGGTPPLSWQSSNLPNGLTLSSDGVLSGAPNAVGTHTFDVVVTDDMGRQASLGSSITVFASAPQITTTSLPDGEEAVVYTSVPIAVSGGTEPFTWQVTGLPAGMTHADGAISGMPDEHSDTPFTLNVTLTDSRGRTAQTTLDLTVVEPEFAIALVNYDHTGDGSPDQLVTIRFTTATGLVESITREVHPWITSNIPEVVYRYTYDSNGYLSRRSATYLDGSGGYEDITFINDTNGNVLIEASDHLDENDERGTDGVTDYSVANQYAQNGDLTEVLVDTDGDGVYDQRTNYTYHIPGSLLTDVRDNDNDGTPDYIKTWTYPGADDRENQIDFDLNGDGLVDRLFTFTWTDNPDGTVTRFWQGPGYTETQVQIRAGLTELEQRTKMYTVTRDTDTDGIQDILVRSTFNAAEQLLTNERDNNGDGIYELRTEKTFNSDGNLLTQRYLIDDVLRTEFTIEYQHWYIGYQPEFESNPGYDISLE